MNLNFVNKKKVLITGHTGFKGTWLSLLCNRLGANVIGISKDNINNKSFHNSVKKLNKKNYYFDLREYNKLKKVLVTHKPEFIFHLAAQALVHESYIDPYETFHNNFNSSLNLLECCRILKLKTCLIFITSDKSYKNIEKKSGYKENEKLGGDDPYSGSKASLEMMINSYTKSFFTNNKYKNTKLAVARAGNVIGGGDFSKNRIIPDAYKCWYQGKKLLLRNPLSTRPWQFVLEPLIGYILLAKELSKGNLIGESFNFGPKNLNHINTKTLVNKLNKYSESIISENFSYVIKGNKSSNFKESNLLQLNSQKARKLLNWKCILDIDQTLRYTAEWYLMFHEKKNILNFTLSQIEEYLNDFNSNYK
jgi:CDP-glucose 4,6-dehydratase